MRARRNHRPARSRLPVQIYQRTPPVFQKVGFVAFGERDGRELPFIPSLLRDRAFDGAGVIQPGARQRCVAIGRALKECGLREINPLARAHFVRDREDLLQRGGAFRGWGRFARMDVQENAGGASKNAIPASDCQLRDHLRGPRPIGIQLNAARTKFDTSSAWATGILFHLTHKPNPDPSSRTENSLRNSTESSVVTSATKIEVRYIILCSTALARSTSSCNSSSNRKCRPQTIRRAMRQNQPA